MMQRGKIAQGVFLVVVVALALAPSPAGALEEFFVAKLRGAEETPAGVSTAATGLFGAQLDSSETVLAFALFYSGIEGGGVTAAHLHLGRPAITGGIVIHLCGSGGKPACPAPPATVSGAVSAADVAAIAGQGLAAGEFAELVRAMRKGDVYVNVHSASFAGGEIRGQIR